MQRIYYEENEVIYQRLGIAHILIALQYQIHIVENQINDKPFLK